MAINGINTYRDTLYKWQGQQLKSTGVSSSNSSASSAVNSLFGGSSSITSQINSMVELTKYAMDKMGVSSDARVTFSQISRYREQLQSEFSAGVKKGLEETGIADLSSLTFTLDKNGAITAIGENSADRRTAQAWLDANPSYGLDLLKNLPADAFATLSEISFQLSSTGNLTVLNPVQMQIQAALDNNEDLAEDTRNRMHTDDFDMRYPIEFVFDAEGKLKATGDDEQATAINEWLKTNPAIETEIKKHLEKHQVDLSAVSLRLGQSGPLQITVNNGALNEIQTGMDKSRETGARLYQALGSMSIDKNISFSLQIDDNGNLVVMSDHPDAAKMQKFFDDNPELVKKYRQIEALAGIDDARKAMQISPAEMRKRIQVESMAAWWSNSGNSNSYFGQYSGSDGLSLLTGLNLTI